MVCMCPVPIFILVALLYNIKILVCCFRMLQLTIIQHILDVELQCAFVFI